MQLPGIIFILGVFFIYPIYEETPNSWDVIVNLISYIN